MSDTTERVSGMGIRAYIALGLTVMTLLFTASFFYFMSMAREVSVSGTRTYGLFMTLAESDKLTDSRNMARLRGAESALAALPSLTAKPAEPEASAALPRPTAWQKSETVPFPPQLAAMSAQNGALGRHLRRDKPPGAPVP